MEYERKEIKNRKTNQVLKRVAREVVSSRNSQVSDCDNNITDANNCSSHGSKV